MSTVRTVTMKGNPLALSGTDIQPGQPAPDCTLTALDLSKVKLSSFKGKRCLISVVPSLDTPVCDVQTKRFNQEAARLGADVVVLTISMDLPFAQKRWCGATGSDQVKVFSDHAEAAFGQAFGVLLKDLRLLARAVFVLDAEGVVRYVQIVQEVTREPDYAAALHVLETL